MEISGTNEFDSRIAGLERKMQSLEPLVKGLVAEMLDFKAFAMTLTREDEEHTRREMRQAQVVHTATPAMAAPSAAVHADGSVVIRPRGAAQPEAIAEPEMVRIMQTDGTMKMEPRYGGAIDNSSVGYGRTKKGTFKSNQAPLIYAADKEKSDSKKK